MSSQGSGRSRRSARAARSVADPASESGIPSSDPIHYGSTMDNSQISGSQKSKGTLSQLFGHSNGGDDSSQLGYDNDGANLKLASQASSRGSIRKRVDIESDSKLMRQINVETQDVLTEMPSSQESHQTERSTQSSLNPQLVVWGTDVSISACKQRFKQFLYHRGFDLSSLAPDEVYRVSPMWI